MYKGKTENEHGVMPADYCIIMFIPAAKRAKEIAFCAGDKIYEARCPSVATLLYTFACTCDGTNTYFTSCDGVLLHNLLIGCVCVCTLSLDAIIFMCMQ